MSANNFEDTIGKNQLDLASILLAPIAFLIGVKFEILNFVLDNKTTYEDFNEDYLKGIPVHEILLTLIFASIFLLGICVAFSLLIVVAGKSTRFTNIVTKFRMGPALNLLVFLIALSFLVDILAIPIVIFD
ncbi:MAG: hypothetical protein ACE5OZ_00990 [Candidatus Heimdallarchaeota archaeon]